MKDFAVLQLKAHNVFEKKHCQPFQEKRPKSVNQNQQITIA